MRLLLLYTVFLYFVGAIQAANTTTTTSYSFEDPSFTTRTLWSIISGSIFTLFACIYTAIHPNIPSPKDSPLLILRRRLGIMIMALIAPELIVIWAMRQWLSARYVARKFKESGYFKTQPQEQSEYHGPITATAEQYVEDHDSTRLLIAHPEAPTTRYGVIHALAKPFKKLLKAYVLEQSEDYMWTQTHSFFVLMGGFMLYVDEKPYRTLEPDEVLKLIRAGCIDVPTLTANQIHDKSKGNVISKGLIVLQVAWFVIQLITRAIYHLETTQLEIGTLAFAVLNFLTYAVWWNKPLDVQCPHPVYWKSTESRPEDHISVIKIPQLSGWKIFLKVFFGPIYELMGMFMPARSPKLRVPTFGGSTKYNGKQNALILFIAGPPMATIFGGVHCMAWFFAFRTHQEQVLWRMSAVAITCIPWFSLLLSVISFGVDTNVIADVSLVLSAMMYVPARVVLLVLMFTTLHNIPPDAYKVVLWTSLVPHLA